MSGWTLFARWEFPSPFDHRICDGCAFLRNAFSWIFQLEEPWKIGIICLTTIQKGGETRSAGTQKTEEIHHQRSADNHAERQLAGGMRFFRRHAHRSDLWKRKTDDYPPRPRSHSWACSKGQRSHPVSDSQSEMDSGEISPRTQQITEDVKWEM